MHLTLALGAGWVLPPQRNLEPLGIFDLALTSGGICAPRLPPSPPSPGARAYKAFMWLGHRLEGSRLERADSLRQKQQELGSGASREVRLTGMSEFLFSPQSLPPSPPGSKTYSA